MPKEITAEQYDELVLNAKGLVIVDFYSTECPPCEALAPKFESLYEVYKDKIQFYKVFRQGNRELALKLGVLSSPTLLFYLDGKEVSGRLSGGIKKSAIKKAITQDLKIEDRNKNVKRQEMNYDLVIIGAGPAGLTASIYAAQAKLKTLVLDKENPGGQVNLTHLVANYPGFEKPQNGFMLMHYMTEQAKAYGAQIMSASEIFKLDLKSKTIEVDDDKLIKSKAIILATGSKPRSLGLPGEAELFGKGISFCATCDGKFFEGKDILVIGGGNSAVEESIFLTQFVKSITMIHQFDEFQANKKAVDELTSNPKVKVLFSHEPRAFIGKDHFEALEVENLKTKEKYTIKKDGVFVFVGYVPQTELFNDQLKTNQWGYIETKDTLETEIPGVYAAGDLRQKQFRQITTAVSDGTIAALNAEKYIRK